MPWQVDQRTQAFERDHAHGERCRYDLEGEWVVCRRCLAPWRRLGDFSWWEDVAPRPVSERDLAPDGEPSTGEPGVLGHQ